jgi:hypothetical protein
MELRLPKPVTSTAIFNIYLVLSICWINVYAAEKPVGRVTADQRHGESGVWNPEDTLVSVNNVIEVAQVREIPKLDSRVIQDRSLDVYERYSSEQGEGEEVFRPSLALDNTFGQRVERRERYRQRQPAYQRPGARRQSFVRERPHQYERQRPSPYSRGEPVGQEFPPRRQYSSSVQQWERPLPGVQVAPPRVQRPTVGISGFDYDNYEDDDYALQPPQPVTKKPNLFTSLFNLIKPKKPKKPVETDTSLSRPSWEFVQEENKIEVVGEKLSTIVDTDQFVPTNADYEDYNLNYVDTDDEPKYPQYTMKDVLYSIKNNESRILTLKKFLSAASGLSDRSGADPITSLLSMPLTIFSFLGIFYAVSALAVLGYKYALLTGGSSNGQAVAIVPVLLIFTVPAVLVAIFLIGQGSLNGRIDLGHLARGDVKNGFSKVDSVDFMYDLGVGATALLGLGWMVSITL